MNCNICSSNTMFFSKNKILKKYDIIYFQCVNCGFVQTQEPFWLNEAYSEAIGNTDVGLVNRNIHLSKIVKAIIDFCFKLDIKNTVFLDYGGGYGLFSRIMRDLGFDFYWYDKYCQGVFVSSFMIADMAKKYDIITAFELFEHFNNPLENTGELFKNTDNIIFSTLLLPPSNPKPDE